jgi:hypothetical protein
MRRPPPDPTPRPDELAENDPELAGLGTADLGYGHMKKRLARIAVLRLEGRGPGAYLDRLLAHYKEHYHGRPGNAAAVRGAAAAPTNPAAERASDGARHGGTQAHRR